MEEPEGSSGDVIPTALFLLQTDAPIFLHVTVPILIYTYDIKPRVGISVRY